MNTPWGRSDHTTRFARGFVSVATPGHGGFMLSQKFADEHLSEAAKTLGEPYNGYLCYEEDCDWAIPALELPEFWPAIFASAPAGMDPRTEIVNTLSSYRPEFLLTNGIEPEPIRYGRWLADRDRGRRIQAKDPDTITAAVNDGPGRVKVWTADGREHHVTPESYDTTRGRSMRLSECVNI